MSQSFIRAFQLHEYTAMNHSVNICVAMYMHGRDKKKRKRNNNASIINKLRTFMGRYCCFSTHTLYYFRTVDYLIYVPPLHTIHISYELAICV